MKKRFIISISLLLLMVFALVGCSDNSTNEKEQNSEKEESASVLQENEDILIETTYGNLSIPYGFEEIITWDEENADGIDKYVFYAVLEDEKIPVYDIEFTEQSLSDLNYLGQIEASDGSIVNVYFDGYEDIIQEDMTEDQADIVYTAQETVNDVISSLNEISTFESGNGN